MKSEHNQLVGIIGHPVAHTLSPAMHTAAFDALRLPFTYGVFDVIDEFLPSLVVSIKKNGFTGVNVTIPHKQRIMPLLDRVDESAAAIGAVNTIVNSGGKLTGYNTDIAGIEQSLGPFKEKIRNASVLVLGAGGSARAAVYAISSSFSPAVLRLYNRTPSRAIVIADQFRKIFPAIVYENVSDPERLPALISESLLVVNTTSVGMTPDIDALPIPSAIRFSNQQIIFDIIYTPIETALLQRAKADGAETINGVEMFVHQGARAFQLWTGKPFPLDIGRQAVLKALAAARPSSEIK
ncbi:MAG: shikimate dehydrogenase [Bacteroidota bacterium]